MSQKLTEMENYSTLNVRFTMKAPALVNLKEFFTKLEKLIDEEQFAVVERMSMDYVEGKELVDLFTKE